MQKTPMNTKCSACSKNKSAPATNRGAFILYLNSICLVKRKLYTTVLLTASCSFIGCNWLVGSVTSSFDT